MATSFTTNAGPDEVGIEVRVWRRLGRGGLRRAHSESSTAPAPDALLLVPRGPPPRRRHRGTPSRHPQDHRPGRDCVEADHPAGRRGEASVPAEDVGPLVPEKAP